MDRSVGTSLPILHFNETKSTGGSDVLSTENIPFEIITPIVQNMTPPGTNLTAQVRTVTGSSVDGSETPFQDQGFEDISLTTDNFMSSPRIIASKLNEDTFLPNVKGSKSLQMTLSLTTTDSRVSPVVDGERISAILTSNRVNDIITNYATDDRVSKVDTDPTACQYISKEMLLENHATSLKVILAAHIHEDADIRAFYAVNNKEAMDPIFVPFPGYLNLNNRGQVIAAQDSNGQSDKLVDKSNSSGFDGNSLEFRDYTFSIDQLPSFIRRDYFFH